MANEKAKHGSAARTEEQAQAAPKDEYDMDLQRDNRRDSAAGTMADLANRGDESGNAGGPVSASSGDSDRGEFAQHARRGQAESPREETLNQPEPHREGHKGGARDS